MRVPEDRPGGSIRCPVCNQTFSTGSSFDPRKALATPPREAPQPIWLRLGQKVGADTKVLLEGVIGGAIGGIPVGVIVGAIAFGARQLPEGKAAGGTIGNVLNGIFFGFFVGFGVGSVAGALVGLSGKLVSWLFRMNGRRAAVFSGILAGAAVTMLLGNPEWAPHGALVGGVLAVAWCMLHRWADSYLGPSPSTRLAQDLMSDEISSRRHEIDLGQGEWDSPMGRRETRSRSQHNWES
jgi:hypothetical protein